MPVAKNGRTVLLGEDDLEVRTYLETALQCQGYAVEVAQNEEEVMAYLQGNHPPVSAVVLDIIMPGREGNEALREIRRLSRDLPVILISGAASPTDVAEAIKNGASDFIPKPVNPNDLRKSLTKAFGLKPLTNGSPTEQTVLPTDNQVFVSTSPTMGELQNLTTSVGWSDAPVLIQGETGVGKEVFARQLHACSPRAKRTMLKLNCAALPSELVESELFGYERGAFTGAFQRKPGMFELADNSTIMLDEIGDMDFKLQAKLLQVLQDHEFQRLGGKETIKVDVRVIAVTHCDLEEAIAENRFREDLYYRLSVITLGVPPLRERMEDIIPLAEFFVRKHMAPGRNDVKIPSTLRDVFLEYQWPGNIRELENTVRKFLIFRDARLVERDLRSKVARKHTNRSASREPSAASEPQQVSVAAGAGSGSNGHFALHATNGVNKVGFADRPSSCEVGGPTPVLVQVANAKRDAERDAILAALKSTNWNRRQAAVRLQTDYKGLLYKIKVLSIKKEKPAPIDLTHSRSGGEG